MKMENKTYVLVFLCVLAIAGAVVYGMGLHKEYAEKAALAAGNAAYFEQQAAVSGSACGDLNSVANVQHLSHHPDRYADCLRQVEPSFLLKATGKTLAQTLGG